MSTRICTAVAVTSCIVCPFSYDPNHDCSCQLWTCTAAEDTDGAFREIPRRNIGAVSPPPDWCPLRENDRLVTLRVK